MKLNSESRPFAVALVVLSAIAAIGVSTFASACVHDDGTVSVCHTAQIAVCASAVLGLALGVASLFISNRKAAGAIFIIAALCGFFMAASPGTLFPLCMMDTMRCHLIMQPFSQVLGIVMGAVGIIAAIRSFRAS